MSNIFISEIKDKVRHWYIPLIVGLVFIGIGAWVFMAPASSYETFTLIFSISFLVSGVFEIVFALSNKKVFGSWGWSLFMGIVNLILGVLLLQDPLMAMEVLAFYVGFLVLFRSIGAIRTALELRYQNVSGWISLMILGGLGVFLSTILIWSPQAAAYSLIVFMGMTFISFGVTSIFMALKLKDAHDYITETTEA